jgi:hypothetical protein
MSTEDAIREQIAILQGTLDAQKPGRTEAGEPIDMRTMTDAEIEQTKKDIAALKAKLPSTKTPVEQIKTQTPSIDLSKMTTQELAWLYHNAKDAGQKSQIREKLLPSIKTEWRKIQESREKKAGQLEKDILAINTKIVSAQKSMDRGEPSEALEAQKQIRELEKSRGELQDRKNRLTMESKVKMDANDPAGVALVDSVLAEAVIPEAKKYEEKKTAQAAKKESHDTKRQETRQDTAERSLAALREEIGKYEGRVKQAESTNAPGAKDMRDNLEKIKAEASKMDSSKSKPEDIGALKGSLAEMDEPLKASRKVTVDQILEKIKDDPAALLATAFNPKAPKDIQERKSDIVAQAIKDMKPWQMDSINSELVRGNERGAFDANAFSSKVKDIVDAQKASANPDVARALAYTPRDQWQAKISKYPVDANGELAPAIKKQVLADASSAKMKYDLTAYQEDSKNITDPKKQQAIRDEIARRQMEIQKLDREAKGTGDWLTLRKDFEDKDAKHNKIMERRKVLQSASETNKSNNVTSPAYKTRIAELRKNDVEMAAAKKARDEAFSKEKTERELAMKTNPDLKNDPDLQPVLLAESKAQAEKQAKTEQRAKEIAMKFPEVEPGYEGMTTTQADKFRQIQDNTVDRLAEKYGFIDKPAVAGIKADIASGDKTVNDALDIFRNIGDSDLAKSIRKSGPPSEGIINGVAVNTSKSKAINAQINAAMEAIANADTEEKKMQLANQVTELQKQKKEAEVSEMKPKTQASPPKQEVASPAKPAEQMKPADDAEVQKQKDKENQIAAINAQMTEASNGLQELQQTLANETDVNQRQNLMGQITEIQKQLADLSQSRNALMSV